MDEFIFLKLIKKINFTSLLLFDLLVRIYLMRKRIITYLILLPLAILTCLSCPLKQEVKILLDITVNTSAQTDNYKPSRACLLVLAENRKCQKDKQHFTDKFFQKSVNITFLESNSLLDYNSKYFGYKNRKEAPIFLLYRQLII